MIHIIVWFCQALRLIDNRALHATTHGKGRSHDTFLVELGAWTKGLTAIPHC
jgi:hypothetical protein